MNILIAKSLHRVSVLDARGVGLIVTMCGRATPLGNRMAEEPDPTSPVCTICLAEEARRERKFAQRVRELG